MQCRSSPIVSLVPLWVSSKWKVQFDPECLREFQNLIYILRFRENDSIWSIHIDSIGAYSRLVGPNGTLKESSRTALKAPMLNSSSSNQKSSGTGFILEFENGICTITATNSPSSSSSLSSSPPSSLLASSSSSSSVSSASFPIPFQDSLLEMEWDLAQIQNRIEQPIPRKKLRTVCLNMICSSVNLKQPIADYRPREYFFKADVNRPGIVKVFFLSETGDIQTVTREYKHWPFQPKEGYRLKVYPLEKKIELMNRTEPLVINGVFDVRIEVIQ